MVGLSWACCVQRGVCCSTRTGLGMQAGNNPSPCECMHTRCQPESTTGAVSGRPQLPYP